MPKTTPGTGDTPQTVRDTTIPAESPQSPCAGSLCLRSSKPIDPPPFGRWATHTAQGLAASHHARVTAGAALSFNSDDAHLIVLILEPTVFVRTSGWFEEKIEAASGSHLLFPAGVPHELSAIGAATNLVAIRLPVELLGRIAKANRQVGIVALPPVVGEHDAKIDAIGRACLTAILASSPATPLLLKSYGVALAAHLCGKYGSRSAETRRDKYAMSPYRLRRVIDYVERNLGEPIRLRDLARVAELSPHHFIRCFTKEMGLPPHRYVIQRRIAHAKELLLDNALPLAQIALLTGFSSQPHFTHRFTKVVGMSPGKWRKCRHAARSTVSSQKCSMELRCLPEVDSGSTTA